MEVFTKRRHSLKPLINVVSFWEDSVGMMLWSQQLFWWGSWFDWSKGVDEDATVLDLVLGEIWGSSSESDRLPVLEHEDDDTLTWQGFTPAVVGDSDGEVIFLDENVSSSSFASCGEILLEGVGISRAGVLPLVFTDEVVVWKVRRCLTVSSRISAFSSLVGREP